MVSGGDQDGVGQGGSRLVPLRPLEEFQSDPRYGGDLHRADLAWARRAASMGLTAGEIRAAILEARDSPKRAALSASTSMPSGPLVRRSGKQNKTSCNQVRIWPELTRSRPWHRQLIYHSVKTNVCCNSPYNNFCASNVGCISISYTLCSFDVRLDC